MQLGPTLPVPLPSRVSAISNCSLSTLHPTMAAPPRPVPPYLRLRTPGFAHHGLKFSPYFDGRAAIASGANFGLVGNGRVHVVQTTPAGLQLEKVYVRELGELKPDSTRRTACTTSHGTRRTRTRCSPCAGTGRCGCSTLRCRCVSVEWVRRACSLAGVKRRAVSVAVRLRQDCAHAWGRETRPNPVAGSPPTTRRRSRPAVLTPGPAHRRVARAHRRGRRRRLEQHREDAVRDGQLGRVGQGGE